MELSVPNLYMKICFPILVTVYLVSILGIKAAAIELIPETFQTTIQVNLLNERSSVLLKYCYDGKKDMQSVRIVEAQKEEALLINNKNKTVYYLSKSRIHCEKSDLNLGKLELWQNILYGEKPLLKMINNTSKPITSDREHGTKTFKTNGTVKDRNYAATFEVIIQIRESNWSTVTGWKKVPVSVTVRGNTSVANQPTSFHYQYEFFNFTGNIKDMSVFKIPDGMMCEDYLNVEEFPDIGKSFHVKIEKIQPTLNKLLEEEWWFQSELMVARHDYTPWDSETPVFEVHDYSTGVKYRIDPATGHCDINPLAPLSDNVITDVDVADKNGLRYLKMNSPKELFMMNGIYYKKGLTMVRDIPCDVYITSRQITSRGTSVNVTLEYYILSSSWQPQKKPIPVKLVFTTENGPAEIYNFISYEDIVQDFSVFDVTPCYSERAQLHFQISIPGKYNPEMRFPLMNEARRHLKEAARVSLLRFQGVTLDYDTDYLYLSAILLGRNRPIELFTRLPHGCNKPPDNHIVSANASTMEMCAQLCVDRSHNVSGLNSLNCNSFYFHLTSPEETKINECHLSSFQQVNASKYGNEEWACFYRSVRGEHKFDISSMEAWAHIKANVSKGGFNITFADQNIAYFASSAEIEFGFLYENEEPNPPKHFYLKDELISQKDMEPPVFQNREVWYDYQRKLLRIHSNFPSLTDESSAAVIDRIYDFNSGFKYILGSNCSSRQIVDEHTEAIFYNETVRDASIMKDPKSMFNINGKVILSGQKRVRGILSDVFVYHLPFYKPLNHTNYTKVVHRVFFKTTKPSSGSKNTAIDRVPVRIETHGLNSHFVMHQNIFNFVSLAPDLKNFDISQCHDPEKNAEICVNMLAAENIPKGNENMFLNSFQNSLAKLTEVSPLRFQNVKLVSEKKNQTIVRFFVLPLTDDQGKKGMVAQDKLLRLIEAEAKSRNISLSFQYGAGKVYQAVSSGINREYPLCSNIQPKPSTTEQANVASCPTFPTAATVTPCPTSPKATTTTLTKSPSTGTSKTITSTPSLTTATASTPTTKLSTTIPPPSTTIPPTIPSTIPKTTEKKSPNTESINSTNASPVCSGLCSRSQGKVLPGSDILSEVVGLGIGLSFVMLLIGLIIGAILHRNLSRNRTRVGSDCIALREAMVLRKDSEG